MVLGTQTFCTPRPRLTPAAHTITHNAQTLGNFVKATFYALSATYGFLTPELWRPTVFTPSPLQEYSDVSVLLVCLLACLFSLCRHTLAAA